ncbi:MULTISPECIES: recombinase family protein [Streptomyces]|uniref:recombinase family protein n=1 Tax=Streptomyces lycopersici TaxID=2974589 RepID=UPI0021D241AA|nr:recombinase family protein [Streptomyces sp. NEAU-383]
MILTNCARGPGPGRTWKPGPPVEQTPAASTAEPIRIGYARCSTAQQELQSQFDALAPVCKRIFSEKISTRVKPRPELEKALKLAYDIKETAPDQEVILTVHELKRLARNTAELMTLSGQLQAAGVQLELLTGPLSGIYDPGGMGAMFFAILAAAQIERNYIREKTLEGQVTAAAKGNHGGRSKVIDDDMLAFARALKDKGVPVPEIAKKLTIKTGKDAGQHPSVASVYRALAEAEETGTPARPEIIVPRRPTRVDLAGPGSGHVRDLPESLATLGVDPAELETVAFTHFHGDHTGWARPDAVEDPRSLFTKARWVVGKGELESVPPGTGPILADQDERTVVVTDGTEIADGVRAWSLPGHTPGHTAWTLDTGDGREVVAWPSATPCTHRSRSGTRTGKSFSTPTGTRPNGHGAGSWTTWPGTGSTASVSTSPTSSWEPSTTPAAGAPGTTRAPTERANRRDRAVRCRVRRRPVPGRPAHGTGGRRPHGQDRGTSPRRSRLRGRRAPADR